MSTEPAPEAPLVIPEPTPFERDENGHVKGMTYHRRSDGRIDWVRHIKPEHIVFNTSPRMEKSIEERYGKRAADLNYAEVLASGKEIDPRHLLVMLMGFVELADLRGYYSAIPRIAHVVSYPLDAAICSVECVITWLPNDEEPSGKASYGTADATMENTGGWGYLSAMAGNRAFVRAVRQGLRIPIMSFDEIAKKDTVVPEAASSPSNPLNDLHTKTLRNAADTHKDEAGKPKPLSFEEIKTAATKTYRDKMGTDPTTWKSWPDIPPQDALQLIKLIKATKGPKKT